MTMRSPRKHDPETDNLLLLADAMANGGDPGPFIEASEARGQQEFLRSDVIPSECDASDEELIALGFVLGDPVEGDRLFRYAKLPDGWKREGADHSMHSNIVDDLGRRRVSVFYKAAFYDRRADMTVVSVSGYVRSCLWDGVDPVLDDQWATRAAVQAVAEQGRDRCAEKAKEWRDGIASGHYQAAQVEEFAVRDEAEAATFEALRARLAGEAR